MSGPQRVETVLFHELGRSYRLQLPCPRRYAGVAFCEGVVVFEMRSPTPGEIAAGGMGWIEVENRTCRCEAEGWQWTMLYRAAVEWLQEELTPKRREEARL